MCPEKQLYRFQLSTPMRFAFDVLARRNGLVPDILIEEIISDVLDLERTGILLASSQKTHLIEITQQELMRAEAEGQEVTAGHLINLLRGLNRAAKINNY